MLLFSSESCSHLITAGFCFLDMDSTSFPPFNRLSQRRRGIQRTKYKGAYCFRFRLTEWTVRTMFGQIGPTSGCWKVRGHFRQKRLNFEKIARRKITLFARFVALSYYAVQSALANAESKSRQGLSRRRRHLPSGGFGRFWDQKFMKIIYRRQISI